MKSILRLCAMLGIIAGLFYPAHAGNYCGSQPSLALVLAIDESSSIKTNEWRLQKNGYVAAFRHPEITEAILGSECGQIMVTFVQWSGIFNQTQMIPWRLLDSPEAIRQFASQIERVGRVFNDNTSIGGAIHFSLTLFDQLEVSPLRKVIDISGDGPDKVPHDYDSWKDGIIPPYPGGEPYLLEWERSDAIHRSVTINGVSIQSFEQDDEDADEYDMRAYYTHNVKTPDGFVIPAEGFADFGRAIRHKLMLEIAFAN